MGSQRKTCWEVKESAFGQPRLSLAWLRDDLSWRVCVDRGSKLLLTPREGLLHVLNVSNGVFMTLWISCRGQGQEWSLHPFPAPFPRQGSVCVVLCAEPLGRAGMVEWVHAAGWRFIPEEGRSGTNQWPCVAVHFVTPLWQAPLSEKMWESRITDINWVNTIFSPFESALSSVVDEVIWQVTSQVPFSFLSQKGRWVAHGQCTRNYCFRRLQVKVGG